LVVGTPLLNFMCIIDRQIVEKSLSYCGAGVLTNHKEDLPYLVSTSIIHQATNGLNFASGKSSLIDAMKRTLFISGHALIQRSVNYSQTLDFVQEMLAGFTLL